MIEANIIYLFYQFSWECLATGHFTLHNERQQSRRDDTRTNNNNDRNSRFAEMNTTIMTKSSLKAAFPVVFLHGYLMYFCFRKRMHQQTISLFPGIRDYEFLRNNVFELRPHNLLGVCIDWMIEISYIFGN